MTPEAFRALASGQRRGVWPSLLRGGLRFVETPYTWAVRWRNRRYDTGRAAIHRVAAAVISVGNLTLGGTGKTPFVEWLARWFLERGVRVGLVSRGYGAKAGRPNDEALELALRLPDVPHVQQANRVAAARRVLAEHDCQALILDDGFQHRRLARDLDIVLLDALEPFGYEHVFPRGMLREPIAGLARADVVALSRADLVTSERRAAIRRRVVEINPTATWLELRHRPEELLAYSGGRAALASHAGQPLAAFCGLGNPTGFRRTLAECGWNVAAFREFPDHYAYTPADAADLAEWAARIGAAAVVCTRKDLVKLAVDRLGELPLWAVSIGLEVTAGQEALEARLRQVRPSLPPPTP